jgi:F0F1-type ATP synthase assembly protein I
LKNTVRIGLLVGLFHACWGTAFAQWSTAQLSVARYPVGASADTKVLFAGGPDLSGNPSQAVDIYDNSTDSWTTASLSVTKGAMAATASSGKVFFAGGFTMNGISSDVVDIYDAGTNLWTTDHLSQARSHLAAASLGAKSFFGGGMASGIGSTQVDIYDNNSGTWSTASLSSPRVSLAAAAAGTKIVFAGGYDMVNGQQVYSNVADIYDIVDGTWTTAVLSQARGYIAAAAIGNKIFFAGGAYSTFVLSNVVDVYDTSTGTWSVEFLSQARTGIAGTAAGSKVFFAGGAGQGTNIDAVDIYDNLTGTWSTSNLSIARNNLGAASLGSKAFFAGGYQLGEQSSQIDIYDSTCDPSILTVSPSVSICSGQSDANLIVSGGSNYVWTPTTGLSSNNGANVTAAPSSTTTYMVSDPSLSACASVTVTVNMPPTSFFTSPNQTICVGSSVRLYASGTSQVSWSPSIGLSSTNAGIVYASPPSTTTYTVTGSNSNGCSVSSTITVTVIPCNGQSTNQLSQGRWSLAGTSVGSKALFGGGTIYGSSHDGLADNYSAVVDIYNNATGTWEAATLSKARTELAATSSGSKALFAGGHHEGGIFGTTSSSVVDIYDDASGSWSAASLSQARHELAAASAGGKSLFGGGFSYENSYSNVVDIYDHASDTWSTATLSVARTQLTATALGTKVFFAGGIGPGQVYSDVVDIYDASSGTWNTASLSQAKKLLVSATVGTKVLFAGGRLLGDSQSAVVDIYDTSTGQWTTATLSKARDNLAATTVGDKVIFGGGYDGERLNTVDIYDNSTNTWTTSALSVARDGLTATSVGSKAIFAGGLGGDHAELVVDILDISCLGNSVDISPSISICAGTSTTLIATGAASYTWTPSTGLSASTGSSVTVSPSTTTTYLVTADHGNGCITTKTVTVTVQNVSLSVSPSTSICAGEATTLTAAGAITYAWSPSPGLSALVGSTITASPSTTTTYNVEGIDARGCKGNSTVTVTVRSLPVLAVTPPTAICIGGYTELSATGATNFTWSPFQTLTSPNNSSTYATPAVTTTYNVEGTDALGCKSNATVTVTVNPLPDVRLGFTPAMCPGETATLSVTGATTYYWSPPDYLSSTTGSVITASPPATTTYSVEGTDALGCKNHTSMILIVNRTPVVTLTAPSVVCAGSATTISARGATNYTWLSPPEVSNATSSVITVHPTSRTVYNVHAVDSMGCTLDAAVTINVNAKPVVTVNNPPPICPGESTLLSASGANMYTWSPTLGLYNMTGGSATAQPSATTVYTVTGTDANGCSDEATTTLTVLPAPNAVVTAPQNICLGSSVLLTVNGASSVTWSPSIGLSASNGTTVSAGPATSTTYTAVATGGNGCSIHLTTKVSVFQTPKPVITSTPSTSRLTTLESSLSDGNQWFESGVRIGGATKATLIVDAPGTYSVQATQNGCTGAMSDLLTIVITGIDQNALPGAMTIYPNPVTESLQVQWMGFDLSQGIELRVVDLSGQVIVQQTIHSVNHSIDVSCLTSGAYLLQASQRDRTQTQRFIKK